MNTNTDPVRALIAKWRGESTSDDQSSDYECGEHSARSECADELEAAIAAAPPSAPVGDDPIDAKDNAGYIEHCADRLERCGLRVTAGALRAIAHEHRSLAQQPAAAQPDWEVAPPGATHYQPHQGAYYKRVSASEWYVWSRVEDRELLRWLPSPGTSDSAELVVRHADALAQQPAAPGGEAVGDWVLVPRVPTDAMLSAAQGAWLNDTLRRTTTMWRAMLEAAPKRPAGVDGAKETDLWRCTVCGRAGTVGRCCGEETREPLGA